MTAIIMTDTERHRARRVIRDLGWQLRKAREAEGLTQQDAANALNTWTTTIGRIERGETPGIQLSSIVKLCEHYDLEIVLRPKTAQDHPSTEKPSQSPD